MLHPQKISTLWIVVLFNMIFADILSFMYPGVLAAVSTGQVEGVTITPMFLVIAAIFIEIAIVMIYVSLSMRRNMNRFVNLMAAAVTILFVVGGGSLKAHYIFFATIEVFALIYVAYLAWTWPADS